MEQRRDALAAGDAAAGGSLMASRYLEPEIERRSRAAMTRWQSQRLREQVRHAAAHSPFYRRKLKAAGVKPALIRTMADLERLPFTTKDELKENQAAKPPWGDVLAVPLAEVLRVHLTSATTGRPLAFLDTREDWHGFYHSYARSLYAYGVRKSDMVMAAFSYGPWIGYWSGFYAAQDLGCLVFPVGGLSTDQRMDALLNYPITVLGCTPSYALFLAEHAAKRGIDLAKDTKIRITWHTGEPGASIPATKARIEAAFGARAYDLPGLTEIAAWGFECDARAGLTHVHEDYCYPEVLDQQDRPVGPGGRGELVFTSLYRKAMPLLRYRTRDIVQVADRRCPCGRTLIAFEGGVLARLDDMKKVRGIIVYPRRIEELVRPHTAVDEFQIVFRRHAGLDEIVVRIDPSPSLSLAERTGLRARLEESLRTGLGLRVTVEITEPGALPRWDHKAKRVKDERTEVPF
jgi:phenylacetate-CoA ligase